eukprot:Em0012g844a
MSTRSGRSYKKRGSVQPEKMSEERIEGLMRMLLEDRKSREAQFEEEKQRQQRVAEEERLRQQRVVEEEKALMREQMEMLTRLVGESRQVEETRTNVSQGSKEGKAQQAYAAMRAEDAGTYQLLKEVILRRYDILDETYRQRFRETVKKEDETVSELAVRLDDLLQKWTKDCKTVAEVRDLMVREQLLNALPRDLKIWVSERKPKTSTEAADMADNYVWARKQERDLELKRESRREGMGMKPWSRDWRNGLQRSRTVNGRIVEGIMLDTGCSRTMVHSDLVFKGQIREGESAVGQMFQNLEGQEGGKGREGHILLDEAQEETWNLGEELDDTIFHGGRYKLVQSRSQKREGRRMHRAKVCLDPPVCMQNTQDISVEELRILQETDPTLEVVRNAVDKKESATGVSFGIKDGLMYRVVMMLLGGDSEPYARDQLVLPSRCRSVVMELAHSIPLAGHLGKNKTTDRVLQRFYWPTLRKDVADFCKRCETCQKTSWVKPQHAPMIPLPFVDEPFQRIAMDIVGPLPRSSSGNRCMLVVCDYAKRYPEAMPMQAVDAEAVAEELVKMFSRVGIPQKILTDQGSNFTSQLLAELYRLLHIRPIRTSPYHPQTDGLVERFNQTLKSMLRKVATQVGEAWDKLIPYVLFAYREVPQSSTRFSPFELLYGREVRGPLDVLRESWVAKEKSSENVVSHIMSIREKMVQMTTVVRESLEKMQASQKNWYDQNARVRTLNEGAMVLVLLPTSSSALTTQWQGPYKVVKQVGKVHYLIDIHDRRKRKRVFHINMLREFLSNSSAACTSYWSENLDVDEDDEIPAQRDEMDALLCELSAEISNTPRKTHLTEHRIETGEKVEKEIQEMLEGGIITPSNSEWSSPVVLVRKKDGSLRLCVHYRRLNSVSESDTYPMPRIDDLIDKLGEARFISTLDLTRGYWQVPVAEEARYKTAFATPFGLYEFTVMPFGLQGASATFQRLMDRIVKGCEKFAAAYLDDLIIFSTSWSDHVLAVESFVTPKTKSQVRAFLGLTGYYRRFVHNYTTLASPLTDLTRKSAPEQVECTAECERVSRQMKTQLCRYPVLRSPDFNKEFVLQTDASNGGIGAVLSQRDAGGGENPIAYFSKKLLPREERYSTIEKECLVIKLGMEAFSTYLLGRHFIIETDHRSLVWMDKLKDTILALLAGVFRCSHMIFLSLTERELLTEMLTLCLGHLKTHQVALLQEKKRGM